MVVLKNKGNVFDRIQIRKERNSARNNTYPAFLLQQERLETRFEALIVGKKT
jgi:hypothetical protein